MCKLSALSLCSTFLEGLAPTFLVSAVRCAAPRLHALLRMVLAARCWLFDRTPPS